MGQLAPAAVRGLPRLFLWSQNLGEASASDVLPLLLLVVAVTAVVFGVLALVFRDARRAALIVTPAVIGLLMFGHVSNLVRPMHVKPLFQLAGWGVLVALGVVAAIRLGESTLRRVNGLLDGLSVVFVVVALVTIVPAQITAATATTAAPASAPAIQAGPSAPVRPARDVYYLILDRYGSDRALNLRFGVHNDLTTWLSEHGFRVLSQSHANYVKTSMSLASTLNMTHLTALAARMGTDSADHKPIFKMLQDSAVVRQFKELGYRYLHIGSYYSETRTDSAADRNLYVGGPSDFGATLFDTTALPRVLERLHLAQGQPAYERAYENGKFDWSALRSIRDAPGPKLVIAHILLPHPPYVFAEDGSFIDHDAAQRIPEHERFAGQLHWTNEQLTSWIESIQALPEDRQPIVIVQADEGPYPLPYQHDTVNFDWSTATPDELVEKYEILNAWYVPGGVDPGLYDSMTSVNTFPTLFSGYFGLDVPRLEDREFTSAGTNRPYDLTEITERLRAAGD